MARGVRRTHTEKLQSELSEVRAAISQYEDSLDELRSREKELIPRSRSSVLRKSASF